MKALTPMLKRLLAWAIHLTGLHKAIWWWTSKGHRVTIISYHNPNPATFEEHIVFLSKHYTFISLDKLAEVLAGGAWDDLPASPMVVTIDDGSHNNVCLSEIIARYQIPATIYLVAGVVGTNRRFWWEAEGLSRPEREKLKRHPDFQRRMLLAKTYGHTDTGEYQSGSGLSWEEVHKWISAGGHVGGHTVFHPILTKCSSDVAREEIIQSRVIIDRELGVTVAHFAYPNGDWNQAIVDIVGSAGYRTARTTRHGWVMPKSDPFRLPVMGVSDDADLDKLALQVTGVWQTLLTGRFPRYRWRTENHLVGKLGAKGHILHIIGQLTCGGAERQLSYLARALQGRGWTQSVVSLSRGGMWKDFLSANNIPVFEIARHPFKPYRLWCLYRIVKRERPQIVMSWSLNAGVYAHWLVGVGCPLRVFAVRGDFTLDTNTAQPSRELAWGRHAIEKAAYVVSNSAWGLTVLREKGLDIARSAVIPNIVFAAGRASVSKPVAISRIVAVGGLKRLKGYDILLRALAIVATHGTRFELVVAGNGPERANLACLAAELGLSDQVRLLGEVEDVPTLLASAQLAVHPSRSEGLSNAVLEAMAEGLPVVATAVGGTPEIIQDGLNGLLVPPDEPHCLADAILRLLRDCELRSRLGQAALQWVRCSCAEDRIADEYDKVFCNILLESRKA